jgi:hypothetical protein
MSHDDEEALPEYSLSELEAFRAMSLFLQQYAERAGDDLLTLIGDTQLLSDNRPNDPAAWEDWLECVRAVKAPSK